MDLYDLGRVPWIQSQLLYHALPRLGREGLVLCRPSSPYVSVGYHQDLAYEVDRRYCRRRGLPVFRREVAGGTVYLDQRQLFFQLVLHKRNPVAPRNRERFFRKFLEPVVATLGELGLPAEIVAPCDIQVGGRKISGNGAGDIGDAVVLVGNILLDFDCEQMAQILNLGSESLRGLVWSRMEKKLTSLRRELGRLPDVTALRQALARNFEPVLPGLTLSSLDDELAACADRLAERFTSDDWLSEPGRRLPYREVKIAEGCYVYAVEVDSGTHRGTVLLTTERGCIQRVEAPGVRDADLPLDSLEGRAFSPGQLRRWARERQDAGGEGHEHTLHGLLEAVAA